MIKKEIIIQKSKNRCIVLKLTYTISCIYFYIILIYREVVDSLRSFNFSVLDTYSEEQYMSPVDILEEPQQSQYNTFIIF